MKYQKFPIISVLVVLILVGSIFYPMALTYPYSETSESYAVVHESTETFNQTIEEVNVSISNPTPVRDLSLNAQRTFQQAKDQPRDRDSWQRTGGVLICSDSLLFCDKPTEPPEFPIAAENIDGDASEKYSVIEDDGEVYIVQIAQGLGLSDDAVAGLVETLVKLALFGSYATFLSFVIWSYRRTHSQEVFSIAGYGLGLTVVSYAFPYAVMLYPFSPEHVVILYIAALALLLYQVGDEIYELRRGDSS